MVALEIRRFEAMNKMRTTGTSGHSLTNMEKPRTHSDLEINLETTSDRPAIFIESSKELKQRSHSVKVKK